MLNSDTQVSQLPRETWGGKGEESQETTRAALLPNCLMVTGVSLERGDFLPTDCDGRQTWMELISYPPKITKANQRGA